jgi:hypothetical protein
VSAPPEPRYVRVPGVTPFAEIKGQVDDIVRTAQIALCALDVAAKSVASLSGAKPGSAEWIDAAEAVVRVWWAEGEARRQLAS